MGRRSGGRGRRRGRRAFATASPSATSPTPSWSVSGTNGGWTFSRRTLQLWQDAYRRCGLSGLADGRWFRHADAPAADDPFLTDLQRFYLSPLKPSKRACWIMAAQKAREASRPAAEYRSACRFLAKLPKAVVTKFRDGEDAYVAKCEPSIERDYAALHTNEQWCGDHHQFDVMVRHEGKIVRPWLTAWMDMRSRRVVGWCLYAHDPNTNSIVSALRNGCERFGVPESLYVDNGKDFDSYALHGRTKWQRRRGKVQVDTEHVGGILRGLGCEARFCWAYHGQSKPIERWFGTLEDQFGKRWPTYCGNKPENKPENLGAKLERGQAPELADFVAAFGEWLESAYNAAPHAGDGMEGRSPAEVFDAGWGTASKRTAAADLLDVLLMKTSRPVKVGKNGVTWSGLRYGQYEPALFSWQDKEVYLRVDEREVGRVLVFSPDDKFLCAATANARIPANATEQQLKEAIAEKKRHRRLVKEYHDTRPRLHDDLPDLMTRAAAARNEARRREQPPPAPAGPAAVVPLGAELADQLPKLRAALEGRQLRRAVGAGPVDSIDLLSAVAEAAGPRAAGDEPADSIDLLSAMAAAPGRFVYPGTPDAEKEDAEAEAAGPTSWEILQHLLGRDADPDTDSDAEGDE